MKLVTVDAIISLLLIALPGVIAYYFHQFFSVKSRLSDQGELTRVIIYGAFFFAWYVKVSFSHVDDIVMLGVFKHRFFYLNTIGILLVAPAVSGLIFGRFVEPIIFELTRGIGSRRVPFPTSWDAVFSSINPCYVIVTLKNGERRAGLFSENSRAGMTSRDIYLEVVYEYNHVEGFGNAVEQSGGMWICADEISVIEYFVPAQIPDDGDEDDRRSEEDESE